MMILFIKKHFWKFMMFCLVGVGAFLIDWVFFNLFYLIHIEFIFSRVFAAGISMIFNFSVNRNLTFSARGSAVKKQVTKWLTVYLIAIFMNIAVGKLILLLLGESTLNANIAYLVGTSIAIPISFLGSLLWVFRKERKVIL